MGIQQWKEQTWSPHTESKGLLRKLTFNKYMNGMKIIKKKCKCYVAYNRRNSTNLGSSEESEI